jgi:hypothetical protein
MKERFNLPQEVVLLKQVEKPDGIYLEDLSLTDVPESEIDNIRQWVGFIRSQLKIGNPVASYASRYENGGGKVSYRIIARQNPLNESRFMAQDGRADWSNKP